MNQWLLDRLIGDSDDRGKIGQVGSATGIVVNALLAVMKFICGVPMKPATKRLQGRSYRFCGVSTC